MNKTNTLLGMIGLFIVFIVTLITSLIVEHISINNANNYEKNHIYERRINHGI